MIKGILYKRKKFWYCLLALALYHLKKEERKVLNNQKDEKYYITTAIDYPNAPPHLGHSLEKVAADVIARYHRLQGYDTYFSMGVDENSQHVLRAAKDNGIDPTTWVNNIDGVFRL